MKKIILIFIYQISYFNLFADCKNSYITVFPNKSNIAKNSIFIIEAYGESESLINQLNKKHKIYLQSGNKKVNLIVKEILKGAKFISQAKLQPEKILEVGLSYQLIIDSLNSEMSSFFSQPIYNVTKPMDLIKPIILSKPKYKNKALKQYGCGPEAYVNFTFNVKDSSELIVKTILKNLKTGKIYIYYLIPKDNEVSVGYGMCSGAFNLEEGYNYEVKFYFSDASGNGTKWKNKGIQFTAPK